MDSAIRVETKMTYEDLRDFLWFHMFRRGKGLKAQYILMIVIFGIALLMFLCLLLANGASSLSWSTWAMMAVVPV